MSDHGGEIQAFTAVGDMEVRSSHSRQPLAIEALTRAEIDAQISTAKRYPRDTRKFLDTAGAMVAMDADLAAQCTYTLPARSGKKGDLPITGPSVRLAEILAVCWQNLRVVGRIIDDDGRQITAQGLALDLESNIGYSIEVRRSVVRRDGVRYGDDMVKTTCNAAIAIATRNATFKVIPKVFVNFIEEAARHAARGDLRNLAERTDRALSWFAGRGVSNSRVFAALGVHGAAEFTLDTLSQLNGYRTAIQDDPGALDVIFPPALGAESLGPSPATPLSAKERLKGKLRQAKGPDVAPPIETPSLDPEDYGGEVIQEREPGSDG